MKFLEEQGKTMKLLGEQIKIIGEKVENRQMEQNTSTSKLDSFFNTCNVPWPSPLDVEKGDVRENLDIFEANWKDYCIGTGMEQWGASHDPRKCSLMLSAIGTAVKKKYRDFELTDDDKKSESSAFKKIRECIYATSNVTYDRYVFNSCNQRSDESFKDYEIRLRKLLKFCGYCVYTGAEGLANDLLRDRIVCGIYDNSVKKSYWKFQT